MAEKTITLIVDDLTGLEVDVTDTADKYTITWRGKEYELDLSDASADALDNWLEEGDVRPLAYLIRSRAYHARVGPDPTVVRTWAKQRGLPVGDRGKIADEIQQQYDKAHNGQESETLAAPKAG